MYTTEDHLPVNMNKSNYHFFSVSLADNIPTLIETLKIFQGFYDKPVFSIICPKSDLDTFQTAFSAYDKVNIISENDIISLSVFEEIVQWTATNSQCVFAPTFRVTWYYQQVLKIIFFFTHVNESSYLVMWDADTLPTSNIKFYEKNEACLYGSRLEFHKPYFKTINNIIPSLPANFFASTVQFFSANFSDSRYLLNCFKDFLPPLPSETFETWVSKVVMTSICRSYKILDASLFSEQELVGLACLCRTRKKQLPILYLRWSFNGVLSKRQLAVVRICGFKHITYENLSAIRERKQTWLALSVILVKEFIRQRFGYLLYGPVKRRHNSTGVSS